MSQIISHFQPICILKLVYLLVSQFTQTAHGSKFSKDLKVSAYHTNIALVLLFAIEQKNLI